VTRLVLRAAAAVAAAAGGLALTATSAGAAFYVFGSELSAPANVAEARQADTAYWQTAFADGRIPQAPVAGQVRSVRIKGIALSNPVAGVPGGETEFHIQVMQPLPDGRFQIRNPGGTSGSFFLPPIGSDPQLVTGYVPVNLCAAQGDFIVFNTVGGWDGTGNGLYPNGTPLQIFSRIPNATASQFTGAGQTNNGSILTATPLPASELLMQVTLGTGADGTGLCPGGGSPPPPPPPPVAPPPPPPPPAASIQKATLPVQRVTVSRTGKLSVSLFCRTGPSRCAGTLRVNSRSRTPTRLGTATFSIASGKTGHATGSLNRIGRKRFSAGKGRLPVALVATTRPGGTARRSTRLVTLRRRAS
jgi:hypothetical protein